MDKVELWGAIGTVIVGLLFGGYKAFKLLVLKTSTQVGDSRTFIDLPALANKAVNNISMTCQLRRNICKDMLRLDLNATYSVLSIVEKSNAAYDKMAKDVFCAYWEGLIEDVIAARRASLRCSALPSVAVKKYLEFKRYQEHMDKEYVTSICNSDFLHSNGNKARAIVDFFGLTARISFKAAQDMIITLNGELNNAVYAGYSCSTCSEKGKDEHCPAHKCSIR